MPIRFSILLVAENNKAINQIIFDMPGTQTNRIGKPRFKVSLQYFSEQINRPEVLRQIVHQGHVRTQEQFIVCFFCRISINLRVNKRLSSDLPETDRFRFETENEPKNEHVRYSQYERLRSWRKSKPHSKWQIQRQFTLVRQLLEVDFGRVLRQR